MRSVLGKKMISLLCALTIIMSVIVFPESAMANASSISRFDISPNKEGKTEFLTGESSYAYVGFAANANATGLNGSKIVIKVAKPPEMTRKDLTVNTITGVTPSIVETDKEFIITYDFKTINGGYSVEIPVGIATHFAATPDGYKLPITATLLDAGGKVIIPEKKVEYTFRTKEFKVEKQVKSDPGHWTFEDGKAAWAGSHDPNVKDHLSKDPNELVPVEFSYRVTGEDERNLGNRYLESYTFEDKIPAGAVFVLGLNPHWTYDEATRTATFVKKNAWRTSTIDFKEDIVLKLLFPGEKIGPTNPKTNNIKLTGVPKDRGPGEKDLVMTDDINFHLLGTLGGLKPRMEKVADPYKIEDTLYAKTNDKSSFEFLFTNIYSDRNMSNLLLNDDRLDSKLKITEIRVPSTHSSIFDGTITIEVEYYDGKKEVIADKIKVDDKLPEPDNKYSFIHKGDNIKSFTLKSDSGVLKPYKVFKAEIDVKIRDPQGTNTDGINELALKNSANFKADFETSPGGTLDTHDVRHGDEVYLYPAQQTTTRIEKKVSTATATNDSVLDYELNVFATDSHAGEFIDYNKILDLLPKGMEYKVGSTVVTDLTPETTTKGAFKWAKALPNQPEVVENYEGTGRTALIWDLSRLNAEKDAKSKEGVLKITYKTQPTVYSPIGNNTNRAYLSWKNVDLVKPEIDRAFDDVYDLNENGKKDDKITSITATVNYIPPNELLVFKEAKGSLDENFVTGTDIALGEVGSEGEYNLKLINNSDIDYKNIYILDVLPHVGDKNISAGQGGGRADRNSQYSIGLIGAITPPTGWEVSYTVVPYDDTTVDMRTFYNNNANWTKTPDFSKVTAFKLELLNGNFKKGDTVDVKVPVKLPEDLSILGKTAYNSYGITFDMKNPFFESNNIGFTTVKYSVEGNVFVDVDENGLLSNGDTNIADHLVELVDKDGKPVNDFDGNPITTKTDAKGHYSIDVYKAGDYRIKITPPANHKLIDPKDEDKGSHITGNDMTDVFTLNVDKAHAIKNAGYIETAVPDPDPVELALEVDKVFTGKDTSTTPFEFTLTGEGVNQTKTISGNGKVTFDAIEYTKAGEFVYTIKETKGSEAGITYDEHEVKVTVTVEDKNGVLVATSNYEGGTTFINTYKAPTPISLEFGIEKELLGRALKANEFTFALKNNADNKNLLTKNDINGEGKFTELTYTEAGTYSYTVSERRGRDTKVEYDKTVYDVTVVVVLSEDNILSIKSVSVEVDGNPVNLDKDYIFKFTNIVKGYKPGGDKEFEEKKTFSISGKIIWADNDDESEKRPAEIGLALYIVNGDGLEDTLVTGIRVIDREGWLWKFNDLPKIKDGVEIEYRIRADEGEMEQRGYKTEYIDGNIVFTPIPNDTGI